METLLLNKNFIFEIIQKVENFDNSLFTHYNIPNIPIYNDTISIIMTSSNRSKQVYYTLEKIEQSLFKNVHLIIVDDSNIDPIKENMINKFAFHIDLIYIRNENKNWVNPVVNYNIGFKFIKGSKVIIQNAEVCYVGDILNYISNNVIDNNYYVFDVKAISSIENNEIIYNTNNLNYDIYNQDIYYTWYQNRVRCVNYHFLTSLTKNTFDIIKNFSYDYTFGFAYDDDDFLLKIKSKNINIINVFSDIYNIGGIHLFHNNNNTYFFESNENIYLTKKNNYETTGNYADIIDNYTYQKNNIETTENNIEIIDNCAEQKNNIETTENYIEIIDNLDDQKNNIETTENNIEIIDNCAEQKNNIETTENYIEIIDNLDDQKNNIETTENNIEIIDNCAEQKNNIETTENYIEIIDNLDDQKNNIETTENNIEIIDNCAEQKNNIETTENYTD